MRRRWVRWPVTILGGMAAVLLVAVGIGAVLPVAHTVSVSAQFDADPGAVWDLVTDVERFTQWRSGVTSVSVLPTQGGRHVWREDGPEGGLTFAVEAWDPGRRMVTRIADQDLPFGGSWTYEVSPDGGGTRLTITEQGEVYNAFFRFVSRFLLGHDRTVRRYLADARAALEGGIVSGSTVGSPARVFLELAGVWVGEGTLLAQPAEFGMSWTLDGDSAVLAFENAFAPPGGTRTTVLTAHAVYSTDPSRPEATWEDSRPERLMIRWQATDSALVSEWVAPTESGRTTYRVLPTGEVDVTDEVRSGEAWRTFGRALYRREGA